MEQEKHNQENGLQGGVGRTHNSGQPEHEQVNSGNRDISHIDQQEGAMHHGETGGSGHFDTKDAGSDSEARK